MKKTEDAKKRFLLRAITKGLPHMHNCAKWDTTGSVRNACFRCSEGSGRERQGEDETLTHAIITCTACHRQEVTAATKWRRIMADKQGRQQQLHQDLHAWMTGKGPVWWPGVPMPENTNENMRADIAQAREQFEDYKVVSIPKCLQQAVIRIYNDEAVSKSVMMQMVDITVECALERWEDRNKALDAYQKKYGNITKKAAALRTETRAAAAELRGNDCTRQRTTDRGSGSTTRRIRRGAPSGNRAEQCRNNETCTRRNRGRARIRDTRSGTRRRTDEDTTEGIDRGIWQRERAHDPG